MRRILVSFVLLFSFITHAQNGTSGTIQENQNVATDTLKQDDSISPDNSYSPVEIREGNMQRVLELTQEMEKRRERDKRNAMIRIGIGVMFLGILVIGLLRKKKK